MSGDDFRILLLEENENLGVMMSDFLMRKNFRVDFMLNAKAGYEAFIEHKHKMCIIDLVLLGDEGFKMIDEIHQLSPETTVIVLLPKLLKVERLNVENEIHLSKPFSIEDLVKIIKYKNRLKLNGLLAKRTDRRIAESLEVKTYKVGKYIFELHTGTLSLSNQSSYLTTKEAGVLAMIVENANTVIKRETILEKIWVNDNDPHRKARSMDVYICKLRKLLIDDPKLYLINHHGLGYQLIGDVSEIEKTV